ncbi:MAG: tetratricopeptide repeat protein [Gemmatimonadota bacterium]|nr:MAG: tetratricopeptide repeat protein [Gemmatimonadota bacterium]
MGSTSRYQRFLADLKRRHVFKVAAVYGAAAFAVMQAADFLVPALRVPEVVATLIALAALLGFPIAVSLAWIFDRTPQGLKRTDAADSDELEAIVAQPRAQRWPAGIVALLATLVFVAGGWWILSEETGTAGPAASAPADRSIAVMPFVNLSNDPDSEYFSDGLAEELINALTQVPGLKVAARTSSFAFKGRNLDVRDIGDTLGVSTVLEGSVRMSGERVRIRAQLTDVESGFNIWSDTYDLEMTDIFAVQDEIARAIVGALEVRLAGELDRGLVPEATSEIDAYTHYLRGRYLWNQRSLTGLYAAIDQFKQAIALDPEFAQAYAGLAEAYLLLPEYGGPTVPEIEAEARAATQRALALDPASSQAHTAFAYYKFRFAWDWEGAEEEFRAAIELNPTYATAHQWYAELLAAMRRQDEALTEARWAYELEPLAPAVNVALGETLDLSGRVAEAVEQFERTLQIAPDYGIAHYLLARAYVELGELAAADSTYQTYARIEGIDPDPLRTYVAALADPERMPEAAAALEASAADGLMYNAEYFAQLGLLDETLAALERAYEERRPYLVAANVWPQFEGLRDEPRFLGFLKRLGL